MYYITPSKDLIFTAKNSDGTDGEKSKWSFKRWLCEAILVDPQFGKTRKDLMMANDIKTKVERLVDGQYLELSDGEYTRLKQIIDEPTGGYNTFMALQMIPHFQSIENAVDKDPNAVEVDKE